METAVRTEHSDTPFHSIYLSGTADLEKPALSAKKAAAKKPKEIPEEPKKSIWKSVFFGLATGFLSFFINVLPENIGKFLSHVFSSMVKAENPFIQEAEKK